jgi:hypothetical protein
VQVEEASAQYVAAWDCSADHPYAVGGGGFDDTGNAALVESRPIFGDNHVPVGWAVVGMNQSDKVTVDVICAK